MQKQIMQDQPIEQRPHLLESSCDSMETTTYQRPLTEDELTEKKEIVTENYNQINRMLNELKLIKEEYKNKIEPLKMEMDLAAKAVETRQEEKHGTLYMFKDDTETFMCAYDDKGDLVHTRRLRQEEKQRKLFSIGKMQAEDAEFTDDAAAV